MKFRIKNTEITLKIIGFYELIGGILGIGLSCWLMLKTGTINGPFLFIFLLAFFLFSFSIQSGNLLLQKSKIQKGIIYSSILQILQLFAIGLGNYSYEFYSGAKGTIGFIFGEGFKFDLNVALSSFNFTINSGNNNYFFKINIVAIIILSILIDIFQEKKRKQIESYISENADNRIIENEIQDE